MELTISIEKIPTTDQIIELISDKKELINIYAVSFLYFIIIMIINYALYITKK
jgi:hypothetical protein